MNLYSKVVENIYQEGRAEAVWLLFITVGQMAKEESDPVGEWHAKQLYLWHSAVCADIPMELKVKLLNAVNKGFCD